MQPTRRALVVAGLAAFLLAWGHFLARPLPIVGAVALTASLLAAGFRFARLLDETLGTVTIEQRLTRRRVSADETTPVTLAVDAHTALPLDLAVTAAPPAGADATTKTLDLARGQTAATEIVEVTWPVAGAFSFDEPRITATDPAGLFEQRFATGSTPTVTVQPRAPRNIHVGEGGDAVAVGFGEHDAGRLGSGLEPMEIRKYVPGDTVRQIDWKATARLNEPHVREFEAETDRKTALIVDHRHSLAIGPPGETALDYLRQIALAFAESARECSDPLGCFTVGDGGITGSFAPGADAGTQQAIHHHLQELGPTVDGSDTSAPGADTVTTAVDRNGRRGSYRAQAGTAPTAGTDGESARRATRRGHQSPGEARRRARSLTDDSPFARTLQPYFDRPNTYVQQVEDDPLFAAVRSATEQYSGRLWTVVLTDDADRAEVRVAVKQARRGGGRVLVFLAPAVLYEVDGLGDLTAAYERYTAFERFRRELAGLERVRAFEVGPADRLSRVLDTGRTARERRRSG
jgi:uncharacterized protein (DUF58 family)